MRSRLVLALTLALPLVASASTVSESVGGSTTQPTASNPRSGSVMDGVALSYDLSEATTLDLNLGLTHEDASAPAPGTDLRPKGGNVAAFSAGTGHDVNDHLSFDGMLSYSPPTSTQSSTTVGFTDKKGNETDAQGLLNSRTNSVGAMLSGTWDTAGDSDFELMSSLLVNGSHLSTTQKLDKIETTSGQVVDANNVGEYCGSKGNDKKVCKRLGKVLQALPATIDQASVGVLLTATVFQTNELTYSGDVFAYSDDPTQVGFFSVASAGRSTASLGNGVPLAPLRWDSSLALAHKFGALKASVGAGYGQYVSSGDTRNVTVKLLYKFSKSWKMWVKANVSSDVDDDGNAVRSTSVTLGVRYTWESLPPEES